MWIYQVLLFEAILPLPQRRNTLEGRDYLMRLTVEGGRTPQAH